MQPADSFHIEILLAPAEICVLTDTVEVQVAVRRMDYIRFSIDYSL
jgi:hypothetical protein